MLPPVTPPASGWASAVSALKPLVPIPLLLVILPALWWFFRDTWKELDDDATRWRVESAAQGRTDYRPFVALAMCAVILTLQEYYGGRGYFDEVIRPALTRIAVHHPKVIRVAKYDELYSFGWWAASRVGGYVFPFAVWKLFFPQDSLLDMGLRVRGFFKHAWIYGAFLAIVLPTMLIVCRQPDFGSYYPFYKGASRSWLDLLVWEGMYFVQFFALEMFFRGFWLGALRRSFGSGAIFAMAVPYCMIHFGKPFLEANGAIVAGIALGSLSMRTKSIYQGFFVHITVAGLMDWLALSHRHALPTVFWPAG
jgi:membrane protease YdiL (CAAX protease family)